MPTDSAKLVLVEVEPLKPLHQVARLRKLSNYAGTATQTLTTNGTAHIHLDKILGGVDTLVGMGVLEVLVVVHVTVVVL